MYQELYELTKAKKTLEKHKIDITDIDKILIDKHNKLKKQNGNNKNK